MQLAAASPSCLGPPHVDQRVHLHGISWSEYESLLAMRGERSGVRATYLRGELELMTPSIDHEALKTRLARLLEAYAEKKNMELEGYGSWTVRSESKARGVEADECYTIGPRTTPPEKPDLAIEVIWTSGGIDKLEVYCGLGVPEVWVWQEGSLRLHILHGEAYMRSSRSNLLPELDPAPIARFMREASQTQAVRAFRATLRAATSRT